MDCHIDSRFRIRKRRCFPMVVSVLAMAIGAGLAPAPAAAAPPAGPTVVAVHRTAAIDVHGLSIFATVATVSLPAGSWSVVAKATLQGTDAVTWVECRLLAGGDSDDGRVQPTSTGIDSYRAVVLTVAHTFSSLASASLRCMSNGATGDVLVRDVRLTAMKVGRLTKNGVTVGSGSPRVITTTHDADVIVNHDLAWHQVVQLSLPAGTWSLLGKGLFLPLEATTGEVDCKLATDSADFDLSVMSLPLYTAASYALEGAVKLGSPSVVKIFCRTSVNVTARFSRITASRVGRLTDGVFGQAPTTTGSGSPVVVSGHDDSPLPVQNGDTPSELVRLALPAGAWAVTAKLYLLAASAATVTCRLRLSTSVDQGRVKVDGTSYADWMLMQVTGRLPTSGHAFLLCAETGGPNQVGAWRVRMIAVKAGSLSDRGL